MFSVFSQDVWNFFRGKNISPLLGMNESMLQWLNSITSPHLKNASCMVLGIGNVWERPLSKRSLTPTSWSFGWGIEPEWSIFKASVAAAPAVSCGFKGASRVTLKHRWSGKLCEWRCLWKYVVSGESCKVLLHKSMSAAAEVDAKQRMREELREERKTFARDRPGNIECPGCF